VAPVKVEVIGRKNPDEAATPPPRTPSTKPGKACSWVQVGAFSDIDNARRVEQKLERAGESTIVMSSPDGLHRVRVGPFDTNRDAEKALKRVRKRYREAQLVPCG
jgi:cell division septation protein DedD